MHLFTFEQSKFTNLFVHMNMNIFCTFHLGEVSACVDDPTYTRNGRQCRYLIRESTIKLCYEPEVSTACCYSCSHVQLDIPGNYTYGIPYIFFSI
jgi:hypothetical protein